MSYGMTSALQTAVYGVLSADSALGALVGSDIFDAVPEGTPPETYVTLGPERVRDRSDGSSAGALHEFSVSVVTRSSGFLAAKSAAAAISDALLTTPMTLARGRVARIYFHRAQAGRNGAVRRIDIWFRARLDEAA